MRRCTAGVEFAWHTGSVPQLRRRAEIHRFREDPECRLFLSSESGGVGLNLQAADTVINMDQPWNPARLEQRIARAWRKHQTRPVTVINLVSEKTIEHRMLGLAGRQAGARGRRARSARRPVRDPHAHQPRGVHGAPERGARHRRGRRRTPAAEPQPRAAIDRLRDDLVAQHGAALQRILIGDARISPKIGKTMLVVLDVPPAQAPPRKRAASPRCHRHARERDRRGHP